MKKPDMTVLLTLRGRHLHTLRWMWHANRTRLPYQIVIADGDVHPTIDRLLSDPAVFPHLSFEYRRYNDASFSDFYRKCADAVTKVDTPYVFMSDNDDFLIPAGIDRSIRYLEENEDYVCAGGQLPDFALEAESPLPAGVVGRMINLRFGRTTAPGDIDSPAAAARVMHEIRHYQTVYYHVYRTNALQTIFDDVKVHDFSDLTVHEYYCALRALTMGKIRTDPSAVCYLRQIGTSMRSTYWVDWVHHLLRSRLPQDYQTLAASISEAALNPGGEDPCPLREEILAAYAEYLRHMLGHTMMRHRFPGLFRIKQYLLRLEAHRIIPLCLRERRADSQFWARLSKYCAAPELLTAYRKEVDGVRLSLQGQEFVSFVKSNAADLLPVPPTA